MVEARKLRELEHQQMQEAMHGDPPTAGEYHLTVRGRVDEGPPQTLFMKLRPGQHARLDLHLECAGASTSTCSAPSSRPTTCTCVAPEPDDNGPQLCVPVNADGDCRDDDPTTTDGPQLCEPVTANGDRRDDDTTTTETAERDVRVSEKSFTSGRESGTKRKWSNPLTAGPVIILEDSQQLPEPES